MTNASQNLEWYLARDGKRYGPISGEELHNYVSVGHVQPEDLLWRRGFSEWVKAKTIPHLFSHSHNPAQFQNQSRAHAPFKEAHQQDFVAQPLVDRPEMAFSSAQKQSNAIQSSEKPRAHAKKSEANLAASSHQPQKVRRKSNFLGQAFFTLFFLFMLLGAGLFVLQTFVSADFMADHIAELVKKKTGRDLIIRGKSSFSVVPRIGVKFKDVMLSNPKGMAGEPLLNMAELELNLNPMALMDKKIEIDRIQLKSPKISLHIDKQGRNNWSFKLAGLSSKAETRHSFNLKALDVFSKIFSELSLAPKPAYAQNALALSWQDIHFDKVYIVDGSVFYEDNRKGLSEKLTDMNFTLSVTDFTSLLYAKGRAKWNAEDISFDGNVTSPENIVQGRVSPLSIDLQSQHFTISLAGKLSLFDGLFFTGDGDFQTASLRDMASWLGNEISLKGGANNFSLRGKIEAQAHRLNFKDANIVLDRIKAIGSGTILFSGARPYIKATIKADTLNLNVYAAKASAQKARFAKGSPRPENYTTLSAYNKKISLSNRPTKANLLVTSSLDKPKKVGAEISARPINSLASGLDALDADINLNVSEILFKNIRVHRSAMTVEIRDGILTANLEKFSLYEGDGTGQFILNGQEAIPAFSSTMKLSDVSAEPFLRDAFRMKQLAGKVNVSFNVKGFGHSENQMLSTLSGRGEVGFQNGMIKGVNIPKFIRALKKGKIEGWSLEPSLKTDFSKLSGTFTVDKGIASNKDFLLTVPLTDKKNKTDQVLLAKGTGTIDLVKQWIDYRVNPEITKLANRKAKKKKKSDIEIPVHIEGPINRPKITPDLGAIAQNSEAIAQGIDAAKRAYKKIKKKKRLTSEDFENLIQGVLGGNGNKKKEKQKPLELQGQSYQLQQFIQQ